MNYNGLRHLDGCLCALESLEYSRDLLEAIIIDNGSQDGSMEYVQDKFPNIRTITNEENSFAKALNLGVRAAKGEYIAFLNNDVTLDRRWLTELVQVLVTTPAAGAAGGKLLLTSGRINSVGIRELPNFFWDDIGFNEEDRGQYDTTTEAAGLCWAAVLFRRKCLEDVGPVDEDFVMYCEDVDYARRCALRGWKFVYTHVALAHHAYAGSSPGRTLPEYFCNRNRFLYIAKHFPDALPAAIKTSHFVAKEQDEELLECMPITIKKLIEDQDSVTVAKVLPELSETLVSMYGSRVVDQLLARIQVALGHRKISMGIYDHALHAIGGGQKYVATMAEVLKDRCEITYIANKPVSIADLESWYQLDLSGCRLKIIPLQFYEDHGRHWIDSGMVTGDIANPFEVIAAESAHYDIFVNANMLEKVRPLSPISVFVCHFPDTARGSYFAVDDYSLVLANCQYTREWLKERWGLEATALVYPPVEMEVVRTEKKPLILSVARFEPGGSKKQIRLIEAFRQLLRSHPEELDGWRLVLVGGSLPDNAYLDQILALVREDASRIDVKVNAPLDEIKTLYAQAEIFWHACGLDETNPQLIEHFGMTTVEAMQNYCVPVVIHGGGQREIVEHGRSGFLFKTADELRRYTVDLMTDLESRRRIQSEAHLRSQCFTKSRFEQRIKELYDLVEREYSSILLPNPQDIIARSKERSGLPLRPPADHGAH